jgi:hypothetical protein
MASPSYAVSQYIQEGLSVQERIYYGSDPKELQAREASLQTMLREMGICLNDNTPVVAIRDGMTDELVSF